MTLDIRPPVTDWRAISRLRRIWDEIDNGDSFFGSYTTALRKYRIITPTQEILLDRLCSRALLGGPTDDLAHIKRMSKRIKIIFTGKGLSPNQLAFAPVCETRLEQ